MQSRGGRHQHQACPSGRKPWRATGQARCTALAGVWTAFALLWSAASPPSLLLFPTIPRSHSHAPRQHELSHGASRSGGRGDGEEAPQHHPQRQHPLGAVPGGQEAWRARRGGGRARAGVRLGGWRNDGCQESGVRGQARPGSAGQARPVRAGQRQATQTPRAGSPPHRLVIMYLCVYIGEGGSRAQGSEDGVRCAVAPCPRTARPPPGQAGHATAATPLAHTHARRPAGPLPPLTHPAKKAEATDPLVLSSQWN